MKILWMMVAVATTASGQEQLTATLRLPTIVTDAIVSGPYTRATVAGEMRYGKFRGWRATGGLVALEDQNLAIVMGGRAFRPLESETVKLVFEPQAGAAFGSKGLILPTAGLRTSLESESWGLESWVQHFHKEGLQITTAEPLLEISRRFGPKWLFVGWTSSFHIAPEPQKFGEPRSEHAKAKAMFYTGPSASVKIWELRCGGSYEIGPKGDKVVAFAATYTFFDPSK